MRTACSLGGSVDAASVDLRPQCLHLVAQLGLLGDGAGRAPRPPGSGTGRPRCRRSRGAAWMPRVKRTSCTSDGVSPPLPGLRGLVPDAGHSVTSPSTSGPRSAGGEDLAVDALARARRAPAAGPTVSSTIAAPARRRRPRGCSHGPCRMHDVTDVALLQGRDLVVGHGAG